MSTVGQSINSLMGGSNNNANFTATQANLATPVTSGMVTNAITGSTGAVNQSQALANALQGQATSGANNQNALAQALMGQMNGTGPNPALAQLNQTTGQNVQNQAALMAGTRGASANAGLMARQIAQQGANTQQQAVGQAATLSANQQIAAEQNLGTLANNQVNQGTNAVNSANTNAQNLQSNLETGINAQNNAAVSSQSNANSANSGLAQTNANNTAGAVGGLLNGAGGALSQMLAHGGVVGTENMDDHTKMIATAYHPHKYAEGGFVPVGNVGSPDGSYQNAAISNSSPLKDSKGPSFSMPSFGGGGGDGFSGAVAGGPGDAMGGALADAAPAAMLAAKGGKVKAQNKSQEAVTSKDSYANDKVPAELTQGETVIDLDTMKDPGPMGKMARTLTAYIQQKNGSGDEKGDFKEALKTAIKSRGKKAA